MKFEFHRRLSYSELRRSLPRRFHLQITKTEFHHDNIALIVFHQNKVILSNLVQRALASTDEVTEPHRIAAGYSFTIEAAQALIVRRFRILAERDSYWTDTRFKSLTAAIPNIWTLSPEDRHRRFVEEIQPTLDNLAAAICEASAREDDVLAESRREELLAFYHDTVGRGYWHPALTEAAADYTEDAVASVKLYRLALRQAHELGDDTQTILIWMAERLFESGKRDEAETCLRDGRAEAAAKNDDGSVRHADDIAREFSA